MASVSGRRSGADGLAHCDNTAGRLAGVDEGMPARDIFEESTILSEESFLVNRTYWIVQVIVY